MQGNTRLRDALLVQLAQLYETELYGGPFPLEDAYKVGRGPQWDVFHGHLVLWFADIAGIASHGKRLAKISAERKAEFRRFAAQPFFSKYPEFSFIEERMRNADVPYLRQRIESTEKARLLIVEALASD